MASKVPIDVSAVLKEATDIEGAVNTPISLTVCIDPSAPGDLASFVHSAFASENPQTRVSVVYAEGNAPASPEDDMAVLVAGAGEWVGAEAARIRSLGVPVMVVSTLPGLTLDLANAFGHPVPDGDLITCEPDTEPAMAQIVVESVLEVAGLKEASAPSAADPAVANAPAGDAPIVLDEQSKARLAERMGRWVIATCHAKRLAFALSFAFVRRPLAADTVHANSMQNAGIGAVMFIPGADMPLMTLNQARMLLQIAAAYGKPMNIERAKELAFVVAGAFACRTAARQLVGMVPGLGWAAKAGVAYVGTEAMGRAAIEYFEAGGDAAGFASMLGKASGVATEVVSRITSTPAGQKAASAAKDAAWAVYDAVGNMRR